MTWLYRHLLRPLLFSQDSESIHNRVIEGLAFASQSRTGCLALEALYQAPQLPVTCMGLQFPNPVGLAAGMDKQGIAVPAWKALGFGFSEVGGVTRHAQPGNPLPRMFRAIPDEALINRMGFNNGGADLLAARLEGWKRQHRWPAHPVGVNLGKSKVTPLEEAASDYEYSFRKLWACADFFVVNVSSPNTPNLRQLQDKTALDEILTRLQEANRELAAAQPPSPSGGASSSQDGTRMKPILVKVAPDLTPEALDEIVELIIPRQLSGIVATNTTVARPTSSHPSLASVYAETGGLSGRPLKARSTEVVRHLYRQTSGKTPIIGVGGVSSADDAWEKVTAGASLIQVYSALVYQGPGVVRSIVDGLRLRLAGGQWKDAIGSGTR